MVNEQDVNFQENYDWFLLALSAYQKKVKNGNIHLSKFEMQLQMKTEYNPAFLTVREWEQRLFLKTYFKDGKPVLIFKKTLEERLKGTDPNGTRTEISYYKADEYREEVIDVKHFKLTKKKSKFNCFLFVKENPKGR